MASAAIAFSAQAGASTACTGKGVELQVLGSGGPELDDKRASASYLIWKDGKASVLVDAGGGSALRFGESGAHVADLDVILFSHLHIDHTSDFPALIKSSYFEQRVRPLRVYGPVGNMGFPSTTAFVSDLFNANTGIYRYLGAFVSGRESGYLLQAHDVWLKPHEMSQVLNQGGLVISATSVIHGAVPALAWRVEIGGSSIVFSGDTSGEGGNLQKLALNANLFVAHNAIPEDAPVGVRSLHMPPSVIGEIAGDAGVRQLVLSHRMLRSLGHEQETLLAIKQKYKGPVEFADDLDCYH